MIQSRRPFLNIGPGLLSSTSKGITKLGKFLLALFPGVLGSLLAEHIEEPVATL
jgi:hypothetical protein